MKEEQIRLYGRLMEEFDFTKLEVKEGEDSILLEREGGKGEVVSKKEAPVVECVKEKEEYISITSPMVGVFYAAPAENAKPYVSIGDRVEIGQTLCIVEAMKLMNEIPVQESGVIVEICVTNGQVVEFGTELFRLKR